MTTTTTSGGDTASPLTTTAQLNAAASAAPVLDANFPSLVSDGLSNPPDPNVAASPTQIVEVVNTRLQVYNRSGGTACPTIDLNTFFGKLSTENFIDPRVIYDNVNNKFTVMLSVESPPPTGPHLPGFPLLRMAHNETDDACGSWSVYSLEDVSETIPEGSYLDQPIIGQDHDAFLFGTALSQRVYVQVCVFGEQGDDAVDGVTGPASGPGDVDSAGYS